MIHVLLVDDHKMTRTGIKFFIEQDENIKVIGEAENGNQCIDSLSSLKPEVILMDINMPGLDGIETSKVINEAHPDIKIIVLTGSASEKEIRASLAAGAKGYCLKDVNYSRLISAIHTVVAGDIWFDSSISGSVLGALSLKQASNHDSQANKFGLSDRELQVLALIVDGKTNQKIATELGLSVDTVKSHLKAIMDKLAVTDRTQAAVKAVREGLF